MNFIMFMYLITGVSYNGTAVKEYASEIIDDIEDYENFPENSCDRVTLETAVKNATGDKFDSERFELIWNEYLTIQKLRSLYPW